MNSAAVQIRGFISNQSSIDYIKQHSGIYIGKGLKVFVTNQGMDLPAGQHAHKSYEFLLPLTKGLVAAVDSKKIEVPDNYLLPINPGQFHGPVNDVNSFKFICIEIDKEYMQELSVSIFGSTEIVFDNGIFDMQNDIMLPVKVFIQESKFFKKGYQLVIKGLQYQIGVNLLRNLKSNLNNMSENTLHNEKRILKSLQYMKENYDHEISLDALADIAQLSKYHFLRVFKANIGKTPNEYLIDLKIEKAKELLGQRKDTITDICYLCGFNNMSHFACVFKRKVGTTPSEFRKFAIL